MPLCYNTYIDNTLAEIDMFHTVVYFTVLDSNEKGCIVIDCEAHNYYNEALHRGASICQHLRGMADMNYINVYIYFLVRQRGRAITNTTNFLVEEGYTLYTLDEIGLLNV